MLDSIFKPEQGANFIAAHRSSVTVIRSHAIECNPFMLEMFIINPIGTAILCNSNLNIQYDFPIYTGISIKKLPSVS